MASNNETHVVKDLPNKRISVTRYFDATPDLVWTSWTDSKILDLWWAPKPWKAETKKMDFREGGHWLYAMVGPNNERHWARMDYRSINKPKGFAASDLFCDENGVVNKTMPATDWTVGFHATPTGTKVVIDITSDSSIAIQKMLEMGFEEGFLSALTNLEEYFAKK